MKLGLFGRLTMALFASLVLGLGMTACGGGTIGYLWVLGQQYNQIAGFKIDDYTGNLTQINNSPFVSNGANPISIVVKPGGRFVFVLNQGVCTTFVAPKTCANTVDPTAGVAVYAVGSDGVLTFQQSYNYLQGYDPQWMQLDTTGSYLYVLNKYSPSYVSSTGFYNGPNTDGNGSVTVYSIDPNTGRLSLVTNSQIQINSVNTPMYEVGASPFTMKVISGCLFTVNSADNSVTPYSVSTSQLLVPSTGRIPTSAGKITSINGNGQYVFITDSLNNNIYQFTVGSGCSLTPIAGGGVTSNAAQGSNPVWSLVDSTSRYLYVLNGAQIVSGSSITPYSTVSAYTINTTNGQLQAINGAPFTVGSGPVCMIEDSSNQYFYTSNHNDGTITGKSIDSTTGNLTNLSRGATFIATGQAECLATSGNVE